MLELNKQYTQGEVIQQLGISSTSFKRRRKDYLLSLELAYVFTVKQMGSSLIYTFLEQKCEWEKPQSSTKVEDNKEQIKQFIRKIIIDKPALQTAANINRIAWESQEKNEITSLGLKQGTTEQYIRVCLKEMFGDKPGKHGNEGMYNRKVWVTLDRNNNQYIPLTDEAIKTFLNMVKQEDELCIQQDTEIFESYKIGEISRSEAITQLGENRFSNYLEARRKFKEAWGYYPFMVPEYLLGIIFTDEEADKIEQKLEAREAAYGLELESFGR